MDKTSERLKGYQMQMSIYAAQHQMILASDVLDMIEQLQDDLKDDTEAVVAASESRKELLNMANIPATQKNVGQNAYNIAIDIVRKGGVE